MSLMAGKGVKIRAPITTGAIPWALLAGLFLSVITRPSAAQAETPMPSPEQARNLIETVLSGEDFGSTQQKDTWVYIGTDADADQATDDDDAPTWLPIDFLLAIASILKWALAIATTAVLLLLGYRLWLELRGLRSGRQRLRRGPDHGDSTAALASDGAPSLQPLPDDIAAAVRALLAADDARGALSLLYRAQIAHLRASGLDIPDSATEADCLEAATRAATPAQVAWLRRLTRLWQGVAYGHRPADPDAIARLLITHPATATQAT
jgi:hypothetical protein